jgi:hypothetical protein
MSYFYPQPLPPMACSTALRHQCVARSRSSTSRKHSTVTASSCQQVGTVGERSWCCATASTRKCGARHGSAICRPRRESTRTATTAREKWTRPSLRTKASSTLLTYLPTSIPSRVKHATNPAPTPQQHNARTSFSREELRHERATRVASSTFPTTHPRRRPPDSSRP